MSSKLKCFIIKFDKFYVSVLLLTIWSSVNSVGSFQITSDLNDLDDGQNFYNQKSYSSFYPAIKPIKIRPSVDDQIIITIPKSLIRLNNHYFKPGYLGMRNYFYLKNRMNGPKRMTDEPPPPGFVGARGRKSEDEVNGLPSPSLVSSPLAWITKQKRSSADKNDYLIADLLNEMDSNDVSNGRRQMNGKKSDSIVYKEGFLGVRG